MQSLAEMWSDYMPATEDVSAHLKHFLQENDLRAVEVVLLSKGIKTFHGFQQELLDPTERQILMEKSVGIYRLLGGPFPRLRQQALKACFGENSLNRMDQDEYSIQNYVGGCSDHATGLQRSFGPAFNKARLAGLGRQVSESLECLARSHELARASLKSKVEAYAAIYCKKADAANGVAWEEIKAAHRACRDSIFWGLANLCYGVESQDAMSEAYKSIAQGVWCEEDIVDFFSTTYVQIMMELAGGPKKSGVVVSKCAAKVMASQGQHADEADAGLHAPSAGCQGSSSPALKLVTLLKWRRFCMLLQKVQVDTEAEGTKASTRCSSACVSSSGFSLQGKCEDKPQTENVTDMLSALNGRVLRLEQDKPQSENVTDLLPELTERLLRLEREFLFLKAQHCMNQALSDDECW